MVGAGVGAGARAPGCGRRGLGRARNHWRRGWRRRRRRRRSRGWRRSRGRGGVAAGGVGGGGAGSGALATRRRRRRGGGAAEGPALGAPPGAPGEKRSSSAAESRAGRAESLTRPEATRRSAEPVTVARLAPTRATSRRRRPARPPRGARSTPRLDGRGSGGGNAAMRGQENAGQPWNRRPLCHCPAHRPKQARGRADVRARTAGLTGPVSDDLRSVLDLSRRREGSARAGFSSNWPGKWLGTRVSRASCQGRRGLTGLTGPKGDTGPAGPQGLRDPQAAVAG